MTRESSSPIRRATGKDLPVLVSLMEEFYREAGFELDHELATAAFEELLSRDGLGCAWIIRDEELDVGHLVLTLRFAMEHAGMVACVDDLFVRPAHRNRGLSTAALRRAREFCETSGVRAMTVEVAPGNGPAQTVCRRMGFVETSDRQLLALSLAPPSHAL